MIDQGMLKRVPGLEEYTRVGSTDLKIREQDAD